MQGINLEMKQFHSIIIEFLIFQDWAGSNNSKYEISQKDELIRFRYFSIIQKILSDGIYKFRIEGDIIESSNLSFIRHLIIFIKSAMN